MLVTCKCMSVTCGCACPLPLVATCLVAVWFDWRHPAQKKWPVSHLRGHVSGWAWWHPALWQYFVFGGTLPGGSILCLAAHCLVALRAVALINQSPRGACRYLAGPCQVTCGCACSHCLVAPGVTVSCAWGALPGGIVLCLVTPCFVALSCAWWHPAQCQ
jgi:hypothetical protein